MLIAAAAQAQSSKWQFGHYTDVKGNTDSGQIRVNPRSHGPIPNEGYIEFRKNKKANLMIISAGDLKTFVTGKDSFVVAHPPLNEAWTSHDLDFVEVIINEDVKLYAARVNGSNQNRVGFGPEVGIGVGTGFGGGGFGGGVGGGISIPLGLIFGGGKDVFIFYFGANTTEMHALTYRNFEDEMSDIVSDYPALVDKIHQRKYTLQNIDKLIADYNKLKGGK